MKNILQVILVLFCFQSAIAQFGVAVKYEKNNYREWANLGISQNDQLYKNDITIGVNYWTRLKNKRIEFLPEVSYTLKNTEQNIDGIVPTIDFEAGLTRLGLQFITQIYPMDLEGDCNCPTWGKDGEFLKKGLFFAFSPGLDYFITDLGSNGGSVDVNDFISFKLGLGAGIDIGLSKKMTLTPFVNVNVYPSVNGALIENILTLDCPECDIVEQKTLNTQISAGLRLHFRPDYKY